jgi:hypothetical protein
MRLAKRRLSCDSLLFVLHGCCGFPQASSSYEWDAGKIPSGIPAQ